MAGSPFTFRRVLAKPGALAVLALLGSLAGAGAYGETAGGRVAPWRIERDIRRFKFVATGNVMELLAIRPGMTILDIGAGTGQFAYEFSRRLNGTGTVYATDTNAFCVDYMRREAAKRGLRNLQPVLVAKDGVDAFYGRNRYDLVTVFHVLMPYGDRYDYFRELRGFLAENGRLALIMEKDPVPFSPADFTGDVRDLIRELSLEPADSPFYTGLRDSTRGLIRDNAGGKPREELRSAIADDFNRMMADTRLGARFLDGSVFRTDVRFMPDERIFAEWLLLSFVDRNVFGSESRTLNAAGAKKVAQINKMLIVQRFRKFLRPDGLFRSALTPAIRAVFEKAGFRLERDYADVIPFEDLIVFSAR